MDTNNGGLNKFLMPVAVLLGLVFIGGAVLWNGSHPAGTTGGDTGNPNIKTVASNDAVIVADEAYIGNPNAPITISFWSDFQCPYCKAAEVGHPQVQSPPALPDLIKNYVDTGKAKIVFKDVVFLSPRMGTDSLTAAVYSRSVWKLYPESYFAWRTAMFTAQDDEGSGFGDAASIDKLNANIAGLDAVKIAADVKANQSAYETRSNANNAEAQKFGVQATPSFIIGKKLVIGAVPYSMFQPVLEELAK